MKKLLVILAVIAMVGAFTATAMAAEWSFYGSARFQTFSVSKDKNSPSNTMPAVGGVNQYDDTDTVWTNHGNIRFGGNSKAGDIAGRYEVGYSGTTAYLRLLYGTWNFGSGTLLVGQSYTPTVQFLSNQVGGADADLLGTGAYYTGRKPMLQLSMSGFKVALVAPSVGTAGLANTNFSSVDVDTTLPGFEASYKYSSDMFWIEPFVGYQSYELVQANDSGESVDSYVFGLGGAVTFGPAQLKASAYMAQNAASAGATGGYIMANPHANGGAPVYANGEVVDNDEFGGMLILVYNINDMLSAEFGYGMRNNELEANNRKAETSVKSYYINLPIQVADGFSITPEIGMVDGGDLKVTGAADVDQGSDTYFGAKWMINF